MSGQAALRGSPSPDSPETRYALVDRCFAAIETAIEAATAAAVQDGSRGSVADDDSTLGAAVGRAMQGVARLRECLDYSAAPVASAYLNSIFDYAIGQLIASRGARELQCLHNAGHVITELRIIFLAVQQRALR